MTGVVVVTGGGRGIGAATAVGCAEAGFDVCVCYRSDAASARGVVEACERLGVRAAAVQADVGVEDEVRSVFAAAAELGQVVGLVNNAGIVAPAARVDELDVQRIEEMLRINVTGAFLCAREAVRRMSTRHGGTGGSIVNVSSRAAVLGAANYLSANGAPGDDRQALFHYNPVPAYVTAVTRYAKAMVRDPALFYAYYNWQVFVRTTHGDVRLTGPGL